MNRIFLLCPLVLLAACSAEVAVETAPFSQEIPITSIGVPVYVEVAIDMPPETQGTITVLEVGADLTVVNPTQSLTLDASARVSTQGTATPETPSVYTNSNLPPYFAQAEVLLPQQSFRPTSRTPLAITSPGLARAVGSKRIWLIVSNTVSGTGIGDPSRPVLRLEDIVLKATVTKPFDGLGGALPVGGL